MQVNKVVSLLINHSGMNTNHVSTVLGKSREWARQAARLDRVPRLDTVANVADVCGVDVVLVDRETGAALGTVTPPRREADD